jgi:MtN3 and saliva related transmembrane protein
MDSQYIKLIGIGSGILTAASMLPQVIKTFKEKKAEDISVVMIFILMGGIAGWTYYGILREDEPIIYTNAFSLLVNSVLLFLRFRYAKSPVKKK